MSSDPRELGDNITHSNDSGTVSVPNGVVVFSGTEIGSVARLICEDGFSPSGPVIRMCVNSGNWSGQSQSCDAVPASTSQVLLWLISLVVIAVGLVMICCCCVCYSKKTKRTASLGVEHAAGLQIHCEDAIISHTNQNKLMNPVGSESSVSNVKLLFQKVPREPDKINSVQVSNNIVLVCPMYPPSIDNQCGVLWSPRNKLELVHSLFLEAVRESCSQVKHTHSMYSLHLYNE